MTSKADWPELKGKSHNLAQVTLWLNDEAKCLHNGSEEQRVRATLLQAYSNMRMVMKDSGHYLTSKQKRQLQNAGLVMLNAYKLLNAIAEHNKVPRWQLKPKHHHVFEGIMTAFQSGQHPQTHWLYKHEDFVGRISKLCSKAHPSTAQKRALERWCLQLALRSAPKVQAISKKKRTRFCRPAKRPREQ